MYIFPAAPAKAKGKIFLYSKPREKRVLLKD
jgi:hypothetical protein